MAFNAIPNFTQLRLSKAGYEDRLPIDTGHPLYSDPLVDPRDFESFDDAQSYYSQPNSMTGDQLPGVPDAPLVRLDVMKRLVRVEHHLRTDQEVREALGAPAHLAIADALRPYAVQEFAFEIAWPAIIRATNPTMSEAEVKAEVLNYCAEPKRPDLPTPHLTGGAVDVALTNLETGERIDRGHQGGAVKGTAYPDFHEGYQDLAPSQSDISSKTESYKATPDERKRIVVGRRILYSAMTDVGGLFVNPAEIWHYGIGDPLSAHVAGGNTLPYYGIAEPPEWYLNAMAEAQAKL